MNKLILYDLITNVMQANIIYYFEVRESNSILNARTSDILRKETITKYFKNWQK